MDIKELEKMMVEHGLVLRAIPMKVTHVFDTYHADKYPQGTIKYMEEYGREMVVVEKVPENAGKFVVEQVRNTGRTVRFKEDRFFDSIEDIVTNI